MNKTYKSLPWDPEGSTYKQEITLENGKFYPGYSRRLGKEEARDKRVLLQNMILRMYDIGYLNEKNPYRSNATQIVYSWKNNLGKFVHAFTLYQDCYEWNSDHFRDYLDDFLSEVYRLKKVGGNPYELLYENRRTKMADPLNLELRFSNRLNLRNYSVRLIKNNIRAFGEVLDFYRKYCEKYFNGFDTNDQSFFDNMKFG